MRVQELQSRVTLLEGGGFLAVVAIMWLDEVLDLPHRLFGFQATPVNWVEGLIETSMVLACCLVVVACTNLLVRRVKHLEGLLPVCSHCHRVRDDQGQWRQIEAYVRDNSDADFSHGICPECLRRHYPQYCEVEPADPAKEKSAASEPVAADRNGIG